LYTSAKRLIRVRRRKSREAQMGTNSFGRADKAKGRIKGKRMD
jgi:hypothetical protein